MRQYEARLRRRSSDEVAILFLQSGDIVVSRTMRAQAERKCGG